MDIIFLGHSSFKIKGKNISLITDPFDPAMVGLKYPKNEADLVTVSHDHPDHNQVDQVTVGKRVIKGPGEYEIAGTSILGFQTYHDNTKGSERGKNTIYVIEMDGLRLCHLGDLGHKLSDALVEDIGQIDVLMVPVGGEYTVGPTEAVDVVQSIEPGIVLPMHYQMPGLDPKTFEKLQPVEQFLNQLGSSSETLPKLSIKEGELLQGEQKVIILERKA